MPITAVPSSAQYINRCKRSCSTQLRASLASLIHSNSFAPCMSNHLENLRLAGSPTGGSSRAAYTSELASQNRPWRAAAHSYPVGFPATANRDYVYEPQFVVRLLPHVGHFVCSRLLQGPDDATYRASTMPLYPWRLHSDVLKQLIRNLTFQVDSEVVEVRKETYGPHRSRVTIVLETPDEI